MACEDCKRREIEGNLEDLDDEVVRLGRVSRNQGAALVVVLCCVVLLFAALRDKGVLSWGDLLAAARDG